MGMRLDYVSLEGVPPMELVRARVAERLKRPVLMEEHPAGFRIDILDRMHMNIVPGERALTVWDVIHGPIEPIHEHPAYARLSYAMTVLGGRPGPIETLEHSRFRQRFEYEGPVPTPLELHEQLVQLGLGGRDVRPPRDYAPWFVFRTEPPEDAAVWLYPESPWLELTTGIDEADGVLFRAAYSALVSFGAKPRPESDW
ncbi:hypothetical protein ACQKGO_33470 [Corallococcus interemptor]|uniref:hypothetical protein n=1 Tax=Corallococcus interemptor TaxID=2316720 RepID=UPI003D0351CC